ncbi:hypothetical protein BXU01_03925 [[Flexibacter] sp. ATCC 35103]|nr:hypothetical protein BXU01_03925 [[Flexibacter] sp. ATCC 35103]
MRKNTFYISILKMGTMKNYYFFSLSDFLGTIPKFRDRATKVQRVKTDDFIKFFLCSFEALLLCA